MSYVLFISEAKLKDSTAINLNVDVDLLLPYVRQSQKLYVETKLGTNLNNKLKDKGKIKYDSLDDLQGLHVGATKSFAYSDAFWTSGLNLDVTPVNDKQIDKLIKPIVLFVPNIVCP